jgi:putative endonuclease
MTRQGDNGMKERCYYVYILACQTQRLYIGVTRSLRRRVWEHKAEIHEGFTKRYHINRLVYFEEFQYVLNAIAREKKLKNLHRHQKIALIESTNPHWVDLAAEWYSDGDFPGEILHPKTAAQ